MQVESNRKFELLASEHEFSRHATEAASFLVLTEQTDYKTIEINLLNGADVQGAGG